MATVLTKEQDERGPIRQLTASRKIVKETLMKSRNELTGIVMRNLAVEQERVSHVSDVRHRFDESYAEINSKVSSGMQDIEASWGELQKLEMPLELHNALEGQMHAADDIVANKLAFIKELEQEVLRRDHEYVNKNAEHSRTIDTFVHQMRQQENDLRELIASELSKVLSSYEQERSTTIIQVQKEVKQLAAKRQEREQSLMKQTMQNANDQRDRLEALRQHQAQEYLFFPVSGIGTVQICVKECPTAPHPLEASAMFDGAVSDNCENSTRIVHRRTGSSLYPYPTKPLMNRCIPDYSDSGTKGNASNLTGSIKEALFDIPGLGQGIGATVNLSVMIVVFMIVAAVLGFAWIFLLKCSAAFLVYLLVLLVPILLASLGALIWTKGENFGQFRDAENAHKVVAIILWVIAGIALLIMFFLWNKLSAAVEIIGIASEAITSNIALLLAPIVSVLVLAVFWLVVIVSCVYNYTSAKFMAVERDSIPYLEYDVDSKLRYVLIFNLIYLIFISMHMYFTNYYAQSASIVGRGGLRLLQLPGWIPSRSDDITRDDLPLGACHDSALHPDHRLRVLGPEEQSGRVGDLRTDQMPHQVHEVLPVVLRKLLQIHQQGAPHLLPDIQPELVHKREIDGRRAAVGPNYGRNYERNRSVHHLPVEDRRRSLEHRAVRAISRLHSQERDGGVDCAGVCRVLPVFPRVVVRPRHVHNYHRCGLRLLCLGRRPNRGSPDPVQAQ
jgi:hypothetical protein